MQQQLNEALAKAMFETVPLEINVIDANDEVVGWNKHETRLFIRPMTCMGLNFRKCHPEKSLPKVEAIINEMKAWERDNARFWIDLPVPLGSKGEPHKILIEFYALRDEQGKYLGCMECTRDIEEIRHLEGEKRLLDT
ncbi:MAG: PAS domain-containing protein [Bacteroidota bacterium]